MGKGQTYLADDETVRGVVKHLRIVLSSALKTGNEAMYLVVNVTTWYDGASDQDSSCILNRGDHPFIKHKSWVNYKNAEVLTFFEIFKKLQDGTFIRKEDLRPDVLKRVQDGAKASSEFPEDLTPFFAAF